MKPAKRLNHLFRLFRRITQAFLAEITACSNACLPPFVILDRNAADLELEIEDDRPGRGQ